MSGAVTLSSYPIVYDKKELAEELGKKLDDGTSLNLLQKSRICHTMKRVKALKSSVTISGKIAKERLWNAEKKRLAVCPICKDSFSAKKMGADKKLADANYLVVCTKFHIFSKNCIEKQLMHSIFICQVCNQPLQIQKPFFVEHPHLRVALYIFLVTALISFLVTLILSLALKVTMLAAMFSIIHGIKGFFQLRILLLLVVLGLLFVYIFKKVMWPKLPPKIDPPPLATANIPYYSNPYNNYNIYQNGSYNNYSYSAAFPDPNDY